MEFRRVLFRSKKLLQWYNILAKYGITDFKATLAPTEGENVDDRAEQAAE